MSIVLLVPRGAEERAVRRRAGSVPVVALRAAAGSREIGELPRERDAVVVGLCGSLGAARVGEVVVYRRIVDPDGTALALDPLDRIADVLPAARLVSACTTPHVVTRAAERTALAAHTSADVVDMEALPIAQTLRARKVRFAMVRVVSDDPRFDLPPIADAFAPDGSLRPLVLAAGFARAPAAASRFVRDVRTALRVLGDVAAAFA